jgi:hypothetical protein
MALMNPVRELPLFSATTPYRTVTTQVRALLPTLLLVYVPALLALGAVFAASLASNVPVAYFLRDPAGTLHVPNYIGVVSGLGVLLWCSCAAVCMFSWAVLKKTGASGQWPAFFFSAGIVTTVLLVDDFFMLHENASQIYWRFGEETVFALYGVMFVFFIARSWRAIASTEFLVFVLACGFMALSLVCDKLNGPYGDNVPAMRLLIEDGAKLLGIVAWLVYFARTCLAQTVPLFAREGPTIH